jgi:hypothetical protein
MKPHRAFVLLLAFIALAGMAALSASSDTSAPLRDFEFTYIARIPALPVDPRLHEFGFHCRNLVRIRLSTT